MKEPEFNHFTLDEYLRRRAAVAESMKKAGIDALLVTTEENVRYLAGLLNQYWVVSMYDDVQVALIPADESIAPALFVGDHLGGVAKTSWIDDVRVWSQFVTGKSRSAVDLIAETLREKKLDRACIGMEVGRGTPLNMPMRSYEALRASLPHARITDCGEAVSSARRHKSPDEIAYVRRACEITCAAFKAGLESLREGMSERELSHIMAEEALGLTDEGGLTRQWTFFINAGRGRTNWFDDIPGDYRFKKGDPVFIDGGVTYRGYWCDMLRIGAIGELDRDHRRIFDANRKANVAAMGAVAPGVKISDLSRAAFNAWRQCGLQKELDEQLAADYDFLGHNVGLGIHEEPLMCSTNHEPLRPGMVFTLEGMLVDRMPLDKTRIALGIEENVLVTETGCERLTPLDNNLWIA